MFAHVFPVTLNKYDENKRPHGYSHNLTELCNQEDGIQFEFELLLLATLLGDNEHTHLTNSSRGRFFDFEAAGILSSTEGKPSEYVQTRIADRVESFFHQIDDEYIKYGYMVDFTKHEQQIVAALDNFRSKDFKVFLVSVITKSHYKDDASVEEIEQYADIIRSQLINRGTLLLTKFQNLNKIFK